MRVCLGQWQEWDSGITTFPGLYLVSAGISRGLTTLGVPLSVSCGLGWLRGLSAACNVLLLVVGLAACAHVYQTRPQGIGTSSSFAVAWPALVVAAWPPLSLYGFLYYTDSVATLCLVASWALSLAWHPHARSTEPWLWASAAVGAFAVLMRQTNAVWVAFVAGEVLSRAHAHSAPAAHAQAQAQAQAAAAAAGTAADDERREGEDGEETEEGSGLNVVLADVLRGAFLPIRETWLYAAVVGGFVVFVVRNGGIVLGDKAAHEPAWHWVQLGCAVLAIGGVVLLLRGPELVQEGWRGQGRWGWWAGMGLVGAAAMTLGANAHPYLLSDNRHFVFYLWRRVLSVPLARVVLGAVAVPAAFVAASDTLSTSTRSRAVMHCFWIACALTLVPAPLLEPRYWTPAVAVFLLHLEGPRFHLLSAYLLLVSAVLGTCGAIAVFLLRPYRWDDGSVARFVFSRRPRPPPRDQWTLFSECRRTRI
jgi:alpha-1,2-glucosyltransferase